MKKYSNFRIHYTLKVRNYSSTLLIKLALRILLKQAIFKLKNGKPNHQTFKMYPNLDLLSLGRIISKVKSSTKKINKFQPRYSKKPMSNCELGSSCSSLLTV